MKTNISFWGNTPNNTHQYYLVNAGDIPTPHQDGIPKGVYSYFMDRTRGVVFSREAFRSDEEIIMPDAPHKTVLEDLEKFWNSRERYEKYKILFKRSILLEGPPGCGKTVLVRQIARSLVRRNGVVLLCDGFEYLETTLEVLRNNEPNRHVVVIMEDIEQYIHHGREEELLSLLDGEHQVDGVAFISTTNNISQLPDRLINRPSRVDVIVHVDLPSPKDRLFYLTDFVNRNLDTSESANLDLNKWASETTGFSVAHLKELLIAVLIMGQEYKETLSRLKKMQK